jgi:hypothetical protein
MGRHNRTWRVLGIAKARGRASRACRRTHHRRPACPVPTSLFGGEGGGLCQKGREVHARFASRWSKHSRTLRGSRLKDTKSIPRKLPKFSGQLQTPIIQSLSDLPVVDGSVVLDEAMNEILDQRINKLILLLKHYKIDRMSDPWLLLSLRLACSFVPGMRVLTMPGRRRGRPAKWKGQVGDELIAAVDKERTEDTGLSVAAAISKLKQQEPERWARLNEARYYEAHRDRARRRQAVKALRKNLS